MKKIIKVMMLLAVMTMLINQNLIYVKADDNVNNEANNEATSNNTEKASEKVVQDFSQDITLKVETLPEADLSGVCKIEFNVIGNACSILAVTPHVDGDFPFETRGDAYRTTNSDGTGNMWCSYQFVVKKDVMKGYHNIPFYVKYKKDGVMFETETAISVYINGKEEKKETNEVKISSTPRLMVTEFNMSKDRIYPNDEFDLVIKLKNTAGEKIKNIKLSASEENNSFYSVAETGNVYIDKMDGEGEIEAMFHLKASAELLNQTYSVDVRADYENGKSESFSMEEKIPVTITLKRSMMLTDLYIDNPNVKLGSDVEIMAVVNNTGKAMLYNVVAEIQGENLSNVNTYVGNVEAGKNGKIDIITRAKDISSSSQNVGCNNKLVVTYEDEDGNKYNEMLDIDVLVEPAVFTDYETVKETEVKTFPIGFVLGGIGIAGFVAGIIIMGYRKKKRMSWMDNF